MTEQTRRSDPSPENPSDVHARLAVVERLAEERWRRLDQTIHRVEAAIERIDRRIWTAAATCAAAGATATIGALAAAGPSVFGG